MKVKIHVDETTVWPAHIRKLVAESAQSGKLIGRISCDQARALPPAFEAAGLPLNPSVPPQVGTRAKDGMRFIMVKIADDDRVVDPMLRGKRLTWVEGKVPSRVWESAWKHDEGRPVKALDYTLDTDEAEIAESHTKKRSDRRKRHDIDPEGKPHSRQKEEHTYRRNWNAAKSANELKMFDV